MKLEPANIVCPACGSGNYMRHLIGKNVGYLDMKCINCNSYFNFDELYKRRIGEVLEQKPMTNGDKLRAMSDEELVEIFANNDCGYCRIHDFCFAKGSAINCEDVWLDWLKQEEQS